MLEYKLCSRQKKENIVKSTRAYLTGVRLTALKAIAILLLCGIKLVFQSLLLFRSCDTSTFAKDWPDIKYGGQIKTSAETFCQKSAEFYDC